MGREKRNGTKLKPFRIVRIENAMNGIVVEGEPAPLEPTTMEPVVEVCDSTLEKDFTLAIVILLMTLLAAVLVARFCQSRSLSWLQSSSTSLILGETYEEARACPDRVMELCAAHGEERIIVLLDQNIDQYAEGALYAAQAAGWDTSIKIISKLKKY